jgi:biopolymer transport protein ExbD
MVGQTVKCPRCGAMTLVIAEESPEAPQTPVSSEQSAAAPANPFAKDAFDAARIAKEQFQEIESAREAPADKEEEASSPVSVGSAFDFPDDIKIPSPTPTEPLKPLPFKSLREREKAVAATSAPTTSRSQRVVLRAESKSADVRPRGGSSRADDDKEDSSEYGLALGRSFREFGEMDLTPAVDVTFQLLIFFMITLSFNIQKVLLFPPPSPEDKGAAQMIQSPEDLEATSVIARIDDRNVITIDDEPVRNTAQLPDIILGRSRSTQRFELVVEAHPDALHETVVTVIDAGNAAGMQKIKLTAPKGIPD